MQGIEKIRSKILSGIDLSRQLSIWRFQGQKIVFTNGCFDILHRGHVEYLAKAATLGDKIVIGLNTDQSVKRLKGADRPLQDQESRALMLASLSFVDAVVFFDEDTPRELILHVQPDVLVKGGDYNPADIVGHDTVKAKNGQVITIEFLEGYSTSRIIKKIKKS
jgi:rfaE bifunctional protein nucleotidyltransferase chain/domain